MHFRINLIHKFIAFLLLAAVLPLLIVGVSAYQVSRTIVHEEAIHFTQALVDAQRDYLDLQSQQIASLIANLLSVEEITDALASDTQVNAYTSLATQARIGYILDGYSNLQGLVSIDIFTQHGTHYHVGDTLNVSQLRRDVIDRLSAEARIHSPNMVWAGIEDNINASSNKQKVLTTARIVLSTKHGSAISEPVGVLLVHSSVEDLYEHFHGVNIGEGASLLIIDAQGRAVYHPDPRLLGTKIHPTIHAAIQGPRGTVTRVIDGQPMLLTYTTSSLSGWTVLSVVPIAALDAQSARIGLMVLLAFAVACVIVGLVAAIASKMIVIPLRTLTRHLQLLQERAPGWESPLPVQGSDEVAELSRWFNTFLETLRAQSRVEAALRESEEQNRLLFEESPDAVVLFNDAGQMVQMNRAFERLTGYPVEQLAGHTLDTKGLVDPDELLHVNESLQAHNRLGTAEFRLTDAHGVVRNVGLRVFDLIIHGHPHALSTMRDITNEKRVEETLRQANTELARAVRAKDEFLANMSHELRTPLNAILGFSEFLLEQFRGPLNERQQEMVGHIAVSGRHLLTLINDILDLSKIEASLMDLQRELVPIADVCEASLLFVREQATKKQLKLDFQINDRLAMVEADPKRLKQMLVNLLSNAVKFTLAGGQVQMNVTIDAAAGLVHFAVQDSGIGIAPDDLTQLFQPFRQLDSRLSREHEGTGLGLALVRRLAELHGGKVMAESVVGQGSRFTITLPYHPAMAQVATTPIASLPAPSNGAELVRSALVIDDSQSAAEQIARYLREERIHVVIHLQGEGAKDQAARLQPTVIFLDLMLPDQSGWTVLAELKTDPRTRDIPVVIASVVDDRAHGLAAGAAAYLVKPVSREMVRQALSTTSVRVAPQQASIMTPDIKPTSRSVRILLAEDNELNLQNTRDYLEEKGYEVVVARTGIEALDQAQTHALDVILMDIQMPKMDGLEAIQRLRDTPSGAATPIIALTALAMVGDQERCLAAGATAYLSKPFSMKALIDTIQQLVISNGR